MTQNPEYQSRLLDQLIAFRDERDWEQFHTPKNLASALVVEASELLSIFQWTPDSGLHARRAEKREEIQREVADIYIYLLFLAHALGIDLNEAVETLTREAFWGFTGPTCDEHYLVHLLRSVPAFVPEPSALQRRTGRTLTRSWPCRSTARRWTAFPAHFMKTRFSR